MISAQKAGAAVASKALKEKEKDVKPPKPVELQQKTQTLFTTDSNTQFSTLYSSRYSDKGII